MEATAMINVAVVRNRNIISRACQALIPA